MLTRIASKGKTIKPSLVFCRIPAFRSCMHVAMYPLHVAIDATRASLIASGPAPVIVPQQFQRFAS